jgi:hypothetical protein
VIALTMVDSLIPSFLVLGLICFTAGIMGWAIRKTSSFTTTGDGQERCGKADDYGGAHAPRFPQPVRRCVRRDSGALIDISS